MSGAWATTSAWLAHTAAGGGALLLLAWVLMQLTRQPARRQRLGEWAAAASLLLAGLFFAPSWLHFSYPRWLASSPGRQTHRLLESSSSNMVAPETSDFDAAADTVPFIGFLPAVEEGREQRDFPDAAAQRIHSSDVAPADSATIAERPATDSPGVSPEAIFAALGAFYVGIVVLLLGRWLIAHIGVWRLLRRATPAPAPVLRLFEQVVAARWVGRLAPRLLVSARLQGPVSCGLFRPSVILPAELCEPKAGPALPWVFAHELTHLERRDPWSCLLFSVAQAFYFYLPWFWWLRRQVRLCQEYVADAAAVDASRADDYAQFLLSLTAAPAAPVAAIGVLGNSSDLFRRVTMLLQNPLRVEGRCPRRCSLAMAGVLVGLAVLWSGLGWRTDSLNADDRLALQAADEPDKPPAKKEDPAKKEKPPKADEPAKVDEDLERALQDLPAESREQIKKMLDRIDRDFPADRFPNGDEMKNQMRQVFLRMAQQGGGRFGGFGGGGFGQLGELPGLGSAGHGRLGVVVDKPSDALVEQLDLPKSQGLVITKVEANSAAAKAGLKANDVLLELNGKPVANDSRKFVKMLGEVKANTPVDVIVLRKGKRETIKGLTLPEAKDVKPQFGGGQGAGFGGGGFAPGGGFGGGGFGGAPGGGFGGFPGGQQGLGMGAFQFGGGPGQIMTTMIRTDDRFTTRYQEGSLIITLTGTVADGKAKVGTIQVHDGKDTHKYESADKVAEQYRDKVKHLAEMSEKGSVRIELKTSLPKKGGDEPEKK